MCDRATTKSRKRVVGKRAPLATGRHYGITCKTCYMKTSRQFPIAPGRTFAAWVCLLAAVLIWTPLWATAWQSGGMACCTGGMCAAHGHAGTGPSQAKRHAPAEVPMDCEHHRGTGIADCSMSCCHGSSHSLTAAVLFVLPAPSGISELTPAMAAITIFAPTDFVQPFEPLSPPPRNFSL